MSVQLLKENQIINILSNNDEYINKIYTIFTYEMFKIALILNNINNINNNIRKRPCQFCNNKSCVFCQR